MARSKGSEQRNNSNDVGVDSCLLLSPLALCIPFPDLSFDWPPAQKRRYQGYANGMETKWR